MACLVDLESLANVISLGTLQVFTFVNAGVILLRMQPPPSEVDVTLGTVVEESSPLVRDPEGSSIARHLGIIKQTSSQIRSSSVRSIGSFTSTPDVNENGNRPLWLVLVFTICAIFASVAFSHEWSIWIVVCCILIAVGCGIVLSLLPASAPPVTFTCPCVPLVPLLGIVCNSYMMGSMPLSTWSVIVAWLSIGLLFYFSYGIHHSELRHSRHDGAELTSVSATTTSALLLSTTTEDYESIATH